jgi:SAM-dependent methyltransferase
VSEIELEVPEQRRQWSRQAGPYHDVFLDPFREGVENPVLAWLDAEPEPSARAAIDLGCGTGPLLPRLLGRFGSVTALDFAPGMIKKSKARLGAADAKRVTFLERPMHELDDLAGRFDVAVAMNSIVMPDVRLIDRTLSAIRSAMRPGGLFAGAVPSIDAIHYQSMLLYDHALDRGDAVEEAERYASYFAEHRYYEFGFGRFAFRGLRQKFWQPFELEHRLAKAGFSQVVLAKVLYPWDESLYGHEFLSHHPRSWDWAFAARA